MDERSDREVNGNETGEGPAGEWVRRMAPRIVFAVVSLGFLLYLAIGTVEARIWRFGRLYFEDRSVRDVWAYLSDYLPNLPGGGVISALYWLSLGVMVIGVILGLWLFLGTEDEDPSVAYPEQTHPDA